MKKDMISVWPQLMKKTKTSTITNLFKNGQRKLVPIILICKRAFDRKISGFAIFIAAGV